MVRFDREEYKEAAVALWNEAFGDSEEYIRFFHANHDRCTCLTLCESDELQSALYLIDGELCGEKGYYLFAAATFKKYRGKGSMAHLLKEAERFAVQNGKSFIALVPAEPSLFGYYSRFGYKTAFYAEKVPIDAPVKTVTCDKFIWCNEHIGYIEKEHLRYGTELARRDGELFSVFDGGYVKLPAIKSEEYRYGMLLPLDEKAQSLTEINAYIGLTME